MPLATSPEIIQHPLADGKRLLAALKFSAGIDNYLTKQEALYVKSSVEVVRSPCPLINLPESCQYPTAMGTEDNGNLLELLLEGIRYPLQTFARRFRQ